MSDTEIAEASRIDRHRIYRVRRGERQLTAEVLDRLLDVLGVEIRLIRKRRSK